MCPETSDRYSCTMHGTQVPLWGPGQNLEALMGPGQVGFLPLGVEVLLRVWRCLCLCVHVCPLAAWCSPAIYPLPAGGPALCTGRAR